MFSSLRVRDFRVWFAGAIVSNIGTWVGATTLEWLVLTEYTDGDALALGLAMAFQFTPALLLVPVTGWVSDVFPRRTVMRVTQLIMTVLNVALAVVLLTDSATLSVLFGYALMFGVVNAFDTPARQSIVTDLVDGSRFPNAIALKSVSYNTARLVGPASAGLLIIAIDNGWLFAITATTNIIMVLALTMIRPTSTHQRGAEKTRKGLTAGIRYVLTRTDLIVVISIMVLVGGLGFNFPIVLATMALELGTSADGYGLLSSLIGIGSLLGALLAARRHHARIVVIVIGAAGFGVTSVIAAFMPTLTTFGASMIPLGIAVITMLTTANAYVQSSSDDDVRGRVMALYMAILLGATPIGAPIIGAIVGAWGPRVAILVGAAAGFTAAVGGCVWLLYARRQVDAAGPQVALPPHVATEQEVDPYFLAVNSPLRGAEVPLREHGLADTDDGLADEPPSAPKR